MSLFGAVDHNTLLGGVFTALLLAVLATWPICALLLQGYRRSVTRGMRRSGAAPSRASQATPVTRPGPVSSRIQLLPLTAVGPGPLLRRAEHRSRRARVVFVIAGCAYGFGATVALSVAEHMPLLPVRTVLLTWVFAWPTVPTVLALSQLARRGRILMWFGYLSVLATLLMVGGVPPVQTAQLALILVGIPALFVMATGARALRGAAWFVVPTLMLTVYPVALVLWVLLPYLWHSEGAFRHGWWFILGCVGVVMGAVAVSLAYGWCFARAYRRKFASEQTLMILQWWFLAALWVTLLMSTTGAAGLLSLLPYLLVVVILMLAAVFVRPAPEQPVRLLLLRTFGSRGRSTKLLRDLTQRWRWIGSVELIVAPDVASETLEPDEFLDFILGRLPQRFVRDHASLQQRLDTLDLAPDRDGRYRVNELLCHDDMWRAAVEALAVRTDAVLIDLRGLTAQNAGVCYELERLVALIPLSRVVAAVDATTDRDVLQRALSRAADVAPGSSPLAIAPAPALQTVELAPHGPGGARLLLAAVGRAAAEGLADREARLALPSPHRATPRS